MTNFCLICNQLYPITSIFILFFCILAGLKELRPRFLSFWKPGKGLPDLLDEVFWMLPFSSARQAKLVEHDTKHHGGSVERSPQGHQGRASPSSKGKGCAREALEGKRMTRNREVKGNGGCRSRISCVVAETRFYQILKEKWRFYATDDPRTEK